MAKHLGDNQGITRVFPRDNSLPWGYVSNLGKKQYQLSLF